MHRRLMQTLLGGVSSAALSCSAFAADMPVKAPPAQVAANSWTGFYGGLHAGGGWSANGAGSVTQQDLLGFIAPLALSVPFDPFAFGGAQIGYNLQLGNRWVVGIEADISASSHTETAGQFAYTVGPKGTNTITALRGLDWFGTVRGRLGFLFDPKVLVYGTGGWVYGRTRNDLNQSFSEFGTVIATATNGTSSTSTGWTAGGGVEFALDPRWSVKFEYDYLAFTDSVTTVNIVTAKKIAASYTGVLPDNSAHTVQIGLNYHFWN